MKYLQELSSASRVFGASYEFGAPSCTQLAAARFWAGRDLSPPSSVNGCVLTVRDENLLCGMWPDSRESATSEPAVDPFRPLRD